MTQRKTQVVKRTKSTDSTSFRACIIDAAHFTVSEGDRSEFIDANRDIYHIAVETWLSLLYDLSGFDQIEIRALIEKEGLIYAIKVASQLSNEIINNIDLVEQFSALSPSPFLQFVDDMNITQQNEDLDDIRKVLFGLRFLKRFSPKHTTSLFIEGVNQLIHTNNRCKQLSQRCDTKITDDLRDIITIALKHVPKREDELISLPPGATFGGQKTLAEKLICAESFMPDLMVPFQSGYPLKYHWYASNPETPGMLSRTSKVVVVEKSFKAVRVIAKEPVEAQVLQARASKRLISSMSHDKIYQLDRKIRLEDQTRNQELARIGSIDGALSTLDLSSASDSISASLVRSIFPRWFVQDWNESRSNYFSIEERKFTTHIASTMGARLTFPVESIVFCGIAILAVEYYSALIGLDSRSCKTLLALVSVYGDDIIIPTCAADICAQILVKLGFLLNDDKSFMNPQGRYRESCGEEYWNGVNLSSKYFPRRTYPTEVIDQLQFLIPLQHKLVCCRRTNLLLVQKIKELSPKITESDIGSAYQDIWSRFPNVKTKYLIPDLCISERELHSTFITKYPTSCKDLQAEDAYSRYAYRNFLKSGP